MNGSIIYKHKATGRLYKILHFGIDEATLTPVVIYTRYTKDANAYRFLTEIWTRPCHVFFDGRFEVTSEVL